MLDAAFSSAGFLFVPDQAQTECDFIACMAGSAGPALENGEFSGFLSVLQEESEVSGTAEADEGAGIDLSAWSLPLLMAGTVLPRLSVEERREIPEQILLKEVTVESEGIELDSAHPDGCPDLPEAPLVTPTLLPTRINPQEQPQQKAPEKSASESIELDCTAPERRSDLSSTDPSRTDLTNDEPMPIARTAPMPSAFTVDMETPPIEAESQAEPDSKAELEITPQSRVPAPAGDAKLRATERETHTYVPAPGQSEPGRREPKDANTATGHVLPAIRDSQPGEPSTPGNETARASSTFVEHREEPTRVAPRALSGLQVEMVTADDRVRLQIRERQGEVQLEVRAADPELRSALRSELPALVEGLESNGVRVTDWRASIERIAEAAAPEIRRFGEVEFRREDAHANSDAQGNGRRRDRQDQQDSSPKRRPETSEEFGNAFAQVDSGTARERMWP